MCPDRTPPTPGVRVFPDLAALSAAAAEEVARRAVRAVTARGRFTLALAGGATPRRLYELLAERYRARVPIPAENVHRIDAET